VFISYARADNLIAAVLREEIIEINRDRVECFLDTETIESGEGWEKKLEAALEAADWLVCIFTGEQSEFCGYEVGVFTRGKGLAKNAGNSRLVCLYDVENYPAMFRAHQNRRVDYPPEQLPPDATFDETGFYQRSELAKFFANFCAYDNLYVTSDPLEVKRQSEAIIKKAKRVTEAFRAALGKDVRADTPTQLGVEIAVASKSGEPLAAIPPDAQVKGTFESFALFDLRPWMQGEQMPSTNWGEVKAVCRSPFSEHIPWIDRLERDMLNAANKRRPGDSEATFFSKDNKVYRAILFRHTVHWDGTHRFGIIFVETLPHHFLGNQKTSLILAGMVVASRFRFSYLEHPDRIAAKFDDKLTDSEFDGNYRQFLYDLERLRQESSELGLLDHAAFIRSFGEGRRGIAEAFLEAGKKARVALEEALPPPTASVSAANRTKIKDTIMHFVKDIKSENARFLREAADAYRDELEVQLGKTAN
jgi:hypothetical protein